MNVTPNTNTLFVRLDNGTYVLNDYSNVPDLKDTQCPILTTTQSTQQCSISQAHVAAVTSRANSFNNNNYYKFYPTLLSSRSTLSSILISIYMHLTNNSTTTTHSHLNLVNDNNESSRRLQNTDYYYYCYYNYYSINCIVAWLMRHWKSLVWNLLKFIALRITLLQFPIGSQFLM